MKNPLIRVAVGAAGGVFVYLLGGGGFASFLAGAIVSVFFRRYDAIDAKYDLIDAKHQEPDEDSQGTGAVSGGNVEVQPNGEVAT